jgi:hypothetical protein
MGTYPLCGSLLELAVQCVLKNLPKIFPHIGACVCFGVNSYLAVGNSMQKSYFQIFLICCSFDMICTVTFAPIGFGKKIWVRLRLQFPPYYIASHKEKKMLKEG